MELKASECFQLSGFSPHQLSFLPCLNCILVTDRKGTTKCIDTVTKLELTPPAIHLPSLDQPKAPLLCKHHSKTSKLVVAYGDRIGARSSNSEAILLESILQTPVTSSSDEVTMEIPMEQVLSFLKDLQILHFSSSAEVLRTIKSVQEQLEKQALARGLMTNIEYHKFATASFTGKVQALLNLFENLVSKLKASLPNPNNSKNNNNNAMALPALPLISSIALRLQLLHPESHNKLAKFEQGAELTTSDTKLMHIEALRRLSLANWPHMDYLWAIPKTMAEAGFYHVSNPHNTANTLSALKGDRVSCFACRVYLYSWEPTDEPWSEHERHATQCGYVRGDYTENVPLSMSEASHPARLCAVTGDSVMCISTSIGTGFVAVGTEQGHIGVWDLDRGLLITENGKTKITDEILNSIVSSSKGQLKGPQKETDSPTTDDINNKQTVEMDTESLCVKTAPKLSELAQAVVDLNSSQDVVKSKDPPQSKVSANTEEWVSVEATKKRDFHITALSVVSLPADKPSASEAAASVSSPALISALTVTRGGVFFPALVVYNIKSNKPPVKSNSSSTLKQAIPPVDEMEFYDPLDPLPPLPPPSIPLVTLTPNATGGSIVYSDMFTDSKMDLQSGALPATINFIHCIPLEGFTCDSNSGLLPEIQHLVPLDCGRLLAVSCTCSGNPILSTEERDSGGGEGDGSGMSTTERSGLFLFKVVRDGDNVLRVSEEPVKVVSVGDGANPIVSMCAIDPANSNERRTQSVAVGEEVVRPEVLLATLTHKGDVTVYSCSSHDLVPVTSYRVDSSDGSELEDEEMKFVDCTYCGSTGHLVVASVSGQVTLLKIRHGIEGEETDSPEGEEQPVRSGDEALNYLLHRPLTSTDLDQLLLMVRTSPTGVLFSCTAPNHWREMSLLQYHRHSPIHMHLSKEEEGLFTSKMFQYQPPSLENSKEPRYLFQLFPKLSSSPPLGCVSIKLTFANTQCLSDRATISLLLPNSDSSSTTAPYKLICGPVKVKHLVDVTGQSLQLCFSHPLLVLDKPTNLLVALDELFSSEYNEMAFSAEPASGSGLGHRSSWRTRAFRHHVKTPHDSGSKSKPLPVQGTITLTLYPLIATYDTLNHSSFKFPLVQQLILEPQFMMQATLAACGYRVEQSELCTLPESLQEMVKSGESELTLKDQFNSLDLLSWLGAVHRFNTESGGYFLLASSVGQLLTSLLYACFIRGDRSLAQKCFRFIMLLYRSEDSSESADQFRSTLTCALINLLPILPRTSSAACVHSFLRVVATLTGSHDRHIISRICLSLLMELTQQISTKSSLPAQLLQTHFKHEGSIFEPELFDIYLSYCQKSTPVVKIQHKVLSTQGMYVPMPAGLDSVNVPLHVPQNFQPIMDPADMTAWLGAPSPATSSVSGAATNSGTTHVITDKGSHTIYDSELQLLLDCSDKTKTQAAKSIDEFTTFKHGSFLLYGQRGLLETMPLQYSCLSVTGGASVQEPNIHTVASVPESTPSSAPVASVSRTSGYRFPTPSGYKRENVTSFERRDKIQMQPVHSALADIAVVPKELVMQIDALKSGMAYTALLKFSCPVLLTDLSIPAAGFMSSVSVDVWMEKGGESEGVRVAQSSEIREKSLMLGNLSPPPVCQFVKVTFIGRLGANREKAQVFLGAFYGHPHFSSDNIPSRAQLFSLEEHLLSQYHTSKEKLSYAVLAYAGIVHKNAPSRKMLKKQCEEEVTACYQQCFKAQVKLARVRHYMRAQILESEDVKKMGGKVFRIEDELVDFKELSSSKLSKLIGCLVDTLLVLNDDHQLQAVESGSARTWESEELHQDVCLEQSPVLSEEECFLLFQSLCIHGVPKLHARACALTIRLCGSQAWWGRFVTKTATELFRAQHAAVFNKERALLQLSALCQRTYNVSDVMECLFQLLESKLAPFVGHAHSRNQATPPDHNLLQWLILLLSHILASLALRNQPKNQSNLFVPSPILPTATVAPPPNPQEEAGSATLKAELTEKRRNLKKTLTILTQKMELVSGDEKIKLREEFDLLLNEYQKIRKQLVSQHRQHGEAGTEKKQRLPPPPPPPPSQELVIPAGPDPILSLLSEKLCHNLAKGLVHYVLIVMTGNSLDFIPVVCKAFSQLLALTKWSYPIHTLLSQDQLNQLLCFSCQHPLSPSYSTPNTVLGSLEWAQRAVQCLLINALYHGEIKPHQDAQKIKNKVDRKDPEKVSRKGKPVLEELEVSNGELTTEESAVNVTILQESTQIDQQRTDTKMESGTDDGEIKKSGQEDQNKEGDKVDEQDIVPQSQSDPSGQDENKLPSELHLETSKELKDKDNTLTEKQVADTKEATIKQTVDPELEKVYHKGDFKKMVGYPPKEKGSFGVSTSTAQNHLVHLLYNSFIISNSVDYRLVHSAELVAESELQNLARRMYETVLYSLLYARTNSSFTQLTSAEQQLESKTDGAPFETTTQMLVCAVENLLTKAMQPQSSLDVVVLLCLWRDLNSLLPLQSPLLQSRVKVKKDEQEHDRKELEKNLSSFQVPSSQTDDHQTSQEEQTTATRTVNEPSTSEAVSETLLSPISPTVVPICSEIVFNLLLDCLLGSSSPSSKLWKVGISLMHLSLEYLWNFKYPEGSPLNVCYDKLTSVLVKLFSTQVEAVEINENLLNQLLVSLMPMKVDRGSEKGDWLGIHMLIEVLVKVLDNERDSAALNSPLFVQLVNSLHGEKLLSTLWTCNQSQFYDIVRLIRRVCVLVIHLLPEILEQTKYPGVVLCGAEQDDDRRRYRYATASNVELKWSQVVTDVNLKTYAAAGLIQFMNQLLSLRTPEQALLPVQEFCCNELDESIKSETDVLRFAPTSVPMVTLIYTDKELLNTIFKLFNSSSSLFHSKAADVQASTTTGKDGTNAIDPLFVQTIFCNFVHFLDNTCKDHSCFFQPILQVLSSRTGEMHVSKPLMTLIGGLTSELDSRRNPEQLLKFIHEGGGRLIFECLVSSCNQNTPLTTGGLMLQSINKLGQKETLKPFKEGSKLINFLPHGAIRLDPCRSSMRDLQNSGHTDHPTRTSVFHHAFQATEKWLQVHINLPYPILLHKIQLYQPLGLMQNGPSAIVVECAAHGTLSPPMPVTPVLQTSGLSCLKIEFQQPPVAQQVVLHLRKPLVTDTLSLSQMHVLGVGYGSSNGGVTNKAGSVISTESPSHGQEDKGHPSAGWLYIIDKWLTLSGEILTELMSVTTSIPDLLPACLTLLYNQETLSQQSAGQLERLLIAMATHSTDYGMTIIQYLLGFSSQEEMGSPSYKRGEMASNTATSLDLFYQLCLPTDEKNKQRLHLALRLIANLPPHQLTFSHHLPPLIKALSSAVWQGGQTSGEYSEDVFKSLAELAFSLEVGSPLKSSLNSLLCALCYCHSEFFSLLLSNCQQVLDDSSENAANLLHTLAQVAQSHDCSSILLKSDLMSRITPKLTDQLGQLLEIVQTSESNVVDQSTRESLRTSLSSFCMLLAFLTDFFRGWNPGKNWASEEENRKFWPLLLEFLSLDPCDISAVEMSFCQEVACEFFESCVSNHSRNKEAFVQLLCNAMNGTYSFELPPEPVKSGTTEADESHKADERQPVLTSFLHKLLVDLVLKQETIPVMLEVNRIDPEQGIPIPSLSLPLTHDSTEFHPSFPIGPTCYFLLMPSDATVGDLLLLCKHHMQTTTTPAPPLPPRRKSSLTASSSSAMMKFLQKKASSPPRDKTEDKLEIANFEVKKLKFDFGTTGKYEKTETNANSSTVPLDNLELVLLHDWDNVLETDKMICRLVENVTNSSPDSRSPALCLFMRREDMVALFLSPKKETVKYEAVFSPSRSLLEIFVTNRGLAPLAECIPDLFPYHWPDHSCQAKSLLPISRFKSHSQLHAPAYLPLHSMVMLGLCLRMNCYGSVLGENSSAVLVLLRLILGAELKDSLSKYISELLPFLPYLVLLESLKTFPAHTELGCGIRRQALEVGVVNHTLKCLSSAGHHSNRVENGETGAESISIEQSTLQPTKVTSSTDRQYWAKGTGFGTGSTTSTWNMMAMIAKQKSEEKYVSLCFAILSEYLSLHDQEGGEEEEEGEEGDDKQHKPSQGYCTPELIELLSGSCLLPALASYLLNDSVLDISNHIELYQSTLDLLSSLASNSALHHLLILPVFSVSEGDSGEVTSLASLTAKLKEITATYQRTAKLKQPKTKSSLPEKFPSRKRAKEELDKQVKLVLGKNATESQSVQVELADKQEASSDNTLPTEELSTSVTASPSKTKFAPPLPADGQGKTPEKEEVSVSDAPDLVELVNKILSVSEKVAKVVKSLQAASGKSFSRQTSLGTPVAETSLESFDAYMKIMKPIQFDTYPFAEENEEGIVKFKNPFHYESRVQSATSATHNAARARRLAQEVATLATSLPLSPSSSVFVRCDEERLDIMKVLITGPSDTPYANGCFEFDVFFPSDYPKGPMLVNLMTTGHGRVRFNPNLYNDGKVCLSALNTWHGRPEEKWNAQTSSFLQILVSIQSLILVPEPYFNEPGYEQYRGTPYGDQKCLTYNANIYVATVQWGMINHIRNPSPCFKEIILRHFYLRKTEVLSQCECWKTELADGIRKLQEAGVPVTHLKEYLVTLIKSVDTLKVEIEKIKPEIFEESKERDGDGEESSGPTDER